MKKIRKLLLNLCVAGFIGATMLGLTACGSPKYTVSFNVNGGAEISQKEVLEGDSLTLPTPEAREGYVFLGWYDNAECTGEAVTEITPSENMTYYAKWEQLAKITLDVNGGSLSSATTLYVKAGENVYNAVKDLKPTPAQSGYIFGEWFVGDKALSKNVSATTEGIALTAKYKVEYTIEFYVQNETLDGYDKSDKVVTKYAYPGETITSQETMEGFKEVTNANAVTKKELSTTPSENVFKHYFDRVVYTVNFNSNYPDDSEDVKTTQEVLSGKGVTVPTDLYFEGYILMGWSTSALSKTAEYPVDAFYPIYNNKDKAEPTAPIYNPTRNTTLYAVWQKGYEDMFGGDDYIFVQGEKVYILRENVLFEGTKDGEEFYFEIGNDLMEGKFLANNMFAYSNTERNEYVASLYDFSTNKLDDKTRIFFDAYNGLKYTEFGEDTSEGTYVVDERGYYTATFTSGPKKGTEMRFLTGQVTVNNQATNAFQVRNEEDVALGSLVRFGVTPEGQIGTYQMDLTLDGYGVATLTMGEKKSNYYYKRTENDITLLNAQGASQGVLRVTEYNNKKGFFFYEKSLDHEYTSENGNKLVLDGMYLATYTVGGQTITGHFTLGATSAMGGQIVNVTDANDATKKYTFLLTSEKVEVPTQKDDGNGNMVDTTEIVTKYYFEQKNQGYAEYYYKNAEGIYYGPLFVIDNAEEGKASIYAYSKTKDFILVATGTYTYNETTKLYTFTRETYVAPEEGVEIFTEELDLANVYSFEFVFDTTSTKYAVYYLYSMKTAEEAEAEKYEVEYTGSKGETLVLVAGLATYTTANNSMTVTGAYKTAANGLMEIQANGAYIYLQVNEEEIEGEIVRTFVAYEHAPYYIEIWTPDGNTLETEAVYLDGMGGTKYVVLTKNEETGKNEENHYDATLELTGTTTEDGYDIYRLECQDRNIAYNCLRLSSTSTAYLFPYNESYNGEYTGKGILKLDGYGYTATYVNEEGDKNSGMYFVVEENVIAVATENRTYYFDITGKTFTLRDEQYGTYIVMDNQGMPGYYLEVDGYQKVTIFETIPATEEGEESTRNDIATVSYTLVDGICTFTFTLNGETVTWIGEFGTYKYNQKIYNVFRLSHSEVEKVYVNGADWSVLILDGVGNAIKYDTDGQKETGTYTLITDTLLYYVNDAGSDAHIYEYNPATGVSVEKKFSATGYYTEKLKGLQFTQYGFVIVNGSERDYYNVVNGNVTIYRQDAENTNANEFGFVAEELGEFGDKVQYNGDTYYKNEGYALTFNRKEESKTAYPVTMDFDDEGNRIKQPLEELTFTPAGSEEFTVSASVKIKDQKNAFSGYVIRQKNEEGKFETYVMVQNFRFDINLTYRVEEGKASCIYEVTGLKFVQSLQPYSYLQILSYLSMFLGPNAASYYPNTIGKISIVTEFDIEGEIQLTEGGEEMKYIDGSFGEASGMFDKDGNLFSFEKLPYEYNEETQLYTITLNDWKDGEDYKFYFATKSMNGSTAYVNVGLVRVQTLTKVTEGYGVYVERVIVSDYYAPGSVFKIELTKNGEVLTADNLVTYNGDLYYIVREKNEEGIITKTEYYKVILKEAVSGEITGGAGKTEGEGTEGEETEGDVTQGGIAGGTEEQPVEKPTVELYDSADVILVTAQTTYTEDGKSYIDIIDGNKVMLVSIEDKLYVATEQTYDEATNTYTVTLNSGAKYTISFTTVEGVSKAVLTLIPVEEEA